MPHTSNSCKESLSHEVANWQHIHVVASYLMGMQHELSLRSISHDRSKFTREESDLYSKHLKGFNGITYGSPEYYQNLERLKPAIAHHYSENRHHPEHFQEGIEGMNLIDVLEMACDWKASTKRHDNGNIYKSININAERFGINSQLLQIIRNTLPLLEKYSYLQELNSQKDL